MYRIAAYPANMRMFADNFPNIHFKPSPIVTAIFTLSRYLMYPTRHNLKLQTNTGNPLGGSQFRNISVKVGLRQLDNQ